MTISSRASSTDNPDTPSCSAPINHAFSKSILSKVASLEYMIFCKGTLAALGHRPWPCSPGGVESEQALWPDLSPSERRSMDLKKTEELNNDGHYFETKSCMRVAYTRCWNWQKGFRGDPRAHQRMEKHSHAECPTTGSRFRSAETSTGGTAYQLGIQSRGGPAQPRRSRL